MTSKFYGEVVSKLFTKYRPIMSEALVDRLYKYSSQKMTSPKLLVDVGCGTGLSTRMLAGKWGEGVGVLGFDNSPTQVAEGIVQSIGLKNIKYLECDINKTELPVEGGSVDVLTCVQSAHWMDLPRLFANADRVLREVGVVAIIGYSLVRPHLPLDRDDPALNHKLSLLIEELHDFLTDYWAVDRTLLHSQFKDIQLPYKDTLLIRLFALLPEDLRSESAEITVCYPWFLLMARKGESHKDNS